LTRADTAAVDGARADSLAAASCRTIFNSATGEQIEFTHVREDIARLNWRSRPGGAITAGLAAEGKTTSRGAPKNPLQLGATVGHFRHESRATSPPVWLQNLILAPLSVLAKIFHVRPYYERWDTQISGLEPERLP
jgi:hypothetical protein